MAQEMRACIVGHGPSMCRHSYGREIDDHDTVIRLKRSSDLLKRPKLFGSKTTVVMGSVVLGPSLIGPWSKRYWLFLDTRTMKLSDEAIWKICEQFYPDNSCAVDRALCSKWIEHYRGIRKSMNFDARQGKGESGFGGGITVLSDELGHLHPSAGMFAIIYAMSMLRPAELNLYGFDNVRSGSFDWSVTRGPDWDKYPDHNWLTESRMIADVAKEYGFHIHHDAEVIRCFLK